MGTGRLVRRRLEDQLTLIARLAGQARAGLAKDVEAGCVFLAIYSGVLTEAGTEIRARLDPSLLEQATVAVRRRAPDADREQTMLAIRLLASLWAAGLVAGVNTRDWLRRAPELPTLWPRMAAQLIREEP
ncbi:hypothetical protein C3486_02790 [Streptomyces sp. Ru73]|uniref:hypothetical protein n=1 Tax=Streptomyces sp. Ru73 TaxID=2080748 RepID=UPI000CDDD244|nr:hypothetical protein [Streptomyces sp. Ru73]POX42830.1 hypothetical protein C3486_02790 [Streptomyces sp. Ru73]